ncbi:MAG: endonuclease [Bacteroidota bacterium]
MKSIDIKEQKIIETRVKKKLRSKSYVNKLDHSAEAILKDPSKARRVKSALIRKGITQLAEELDKATSGNVSPEEIEGMRRNYLPEKTTQNISDSDATEVKKKVAKIAVEAVQGMKDMVSSRFLHEGALRAKTVGRIGKYQGSEAIGTGFMISPNLLMTNQHVLENLEETRGCYVEFDFFYSRDNTRVNSEIFELRPDGFYHSNAIHDYAIVMVSAISDGGIELGNYGWNALSVPKSLPEPSDRLNIIHHPRGGHQQISIRKNYVVDFDNEDIYIDYLTDTDYGSSGSPVYDDNWNLIALHRGHVTIEDKKSKENFLAMLETISKDVASEMKNNKLTVNIGVKINDILRDLRERSSNMEKDAQILIDQIFEFTPQEIVPPTKQKHVDMPTNTEFPEASIAHNINISGGEVTLNIAKSISSEMHSTQKDSTPNPPDSKVALELYKRSLTSQTSIFKALDYVQKARELPYLESAAQLKSIQEEYYGSIIAEAQNMNGTELYDSLSEIMQSTLKIVGKFPDPLDLEEGVEEESSTPSSYHKARAHLYTRIDLQPDGSLRGIYTGSVIAPEQLMLVDLINSLKEIDYQLPKRYKNADYLNCEHIVPKTYFDRQEVGFSDLHHLITSDGAVNKFRNKDTYADLGKEGDDGRDRIPLYIPSGGWKRDGHFEPARGKGLVARATLYFIVAHPEFISKEVYSLSQIKTLISWAKAEEPNDYEKHRNQTIFEVQGNRNPFIDFPEWVDLVDFERGLSE